MSFKDFKAKNEDFYKIFKDSSAAQRAAIYSNDRWKYVDKIPEESMKTKNESDKVFAAAANKEQMERWSFNGLNSDYVALTPFLKDDIVVYGLHYINEDGDALKKNELHFFRVDGRWIFLPQAYKAFL